MTNTEIENKLQITEMKGDLKLLNQKIHTIETNHLVHLQKDIDKINKVLFMVHSQNKSDGSLQSLKKR